MISELRNVNGAFYVLMLPDSKCQLGFPTQEKNGGQSETYAKKRIGCH
jgi:hypothetical protein